MRIAGGASYSNLTGGLGLQFHLVAEVQLGHHTEVQVHDDRPVRPRRPLRPRGPLHPRGVVRTVDDVVR